jgi:hypothetical protein
MGRFWVRFAVGFCPWNQGFVLGGTDALRARTCRKKGRAGKVQPQSLKKIQPSDLLPVNIFGNPIPWPQASNYKQVFNLTHGAARFAAAVTDAPHQS